MKDKGHKETGGLRDLLSDYELTPTDRVWQGIEAAAPVPVATPPRFRPYFYGAAAVVIVAALFVVIQTLRYDGADDMESVDLFVEQPWSVDEGSTPELPGDPDPGAAAADPATASDGAPGGQHVAPSQPTASDGSSDGTGEAFRTQPSGSGTPQATPPSPRTEAHRPRPINAGTITPAETTTLPVVTPHTTPEEPAVAPVEIPAEIPAEELVKWEVPNAFIPNYDGVNDYFGPVILNGADISDFRMQIFTRSGNLLFDSNHIDQGWDGRYNSAPMPHGVYIWAISFRDADGKAYARRGHVTLLR